jgi:hypothetical protein
MASINGSSALVDEECDIVPINDLMLSLNKDDYFGGDIFQKATFFYTENRPLKIIHSTQGTANLAADTVINELSGNIVCVLPASILPDQDDNSMLKSELSVYTLQTENIMLKCKINELESVSEMIVANYQPVTSFLYKDLLYTLRPEEVAIMHIFKEAPFKQFIITSISCLLIGILLLLGQNMQIGAVFVCLFLVLSFFSGFSLWSLHDIALARPQFMVAGFIGSLGLLITAIGCLLI